MELPHQLDLFAQTNFTPALKLNTLQMEADALVRWKCQIAEYQGRVRNSKLEQQISLFDTTPANCDPEAVDPFSLRLCPMSFYRLPVEGSGHACLYFVLDTAAQLMLYVGETCRSTQGFGTGGKDGV